MSRELHDKAILCIFARFGPSHRETNKNAKGGAGEGEEKNPDPQNVQVFLVGGKIILARAQLRAPLGMPAAGKVLIG